MSNMNTTIVAEKPPNTSGDTGNTVPYGVSFIFVVIFLLIALCYGSSMYKRGILSRSPRTTNLSLVSDTNYDNSDDDDNHHSIRFSQGIHEDILVTFPTTLYSEIMIPNKGDSSTESSGCSICLADYKPTNVIRLLPECGHLYHVICIDTWLKVHNTCPVCRNTALPTV